MVFLNYTNRNNHDDVLEKLSVKKEEESSN